MVDGSKDEAQLACACTTTNRARSFEGFVVHMHLACLYLLHAEFERDGIDYHNWRKLGHAKRLDKIRGEPKRWDHSISPPLAGTP